MTHTPLNMRSHTEHTKCSCRLAAHKTHSLPHYAALLCSPPFLLGLVRKGLLFSESPELCLLTMKKLFFPSRLCKEYLLSVTCIWEMQDIIFSKIFSSRKIRVALIKQFLLSLHPLEAFFEVRSLKVLILLDSYERKIRRKGKNYICCAHSWLNPIVFKTILLPCSPKLSFLLFIHSGTEHALIKHFLTQSV